jgi:hypothetical protein
MSIELMVFVGIVILLSIVNAVQKMMKVKTPIFLAMRGFLANGNTYIICNFNTFLGNLFILGAFIEAGTTMLAARGSESIILNYSKFFLIALIEWATMSFGIYNLNMIGKSWKLLGCSIIPKSKKLFILIGIAIIAAILTYGFKIFMPITFINFMILLIIIGLMNVSWVMFKVHVLTGIVFPMISLLCTGLLLYFIFAGAQAIVFLDGEPIPLFGGLASLDLNKITAKHDTIASVVVTVASVLLGFSTLIGYDKGVNQDYIKNIYKIHNYVPSAKNAISEIAKQFAKFKIDKDKLGKEIEESDHSDVLELWIIKAENYRYKMESKTSTFKDVDSPAYDNHYKNLKIGYKYIVDEIAKFNNKAYNPGPFKHKA